MDSVAAIQILGIQSRYKSVVRARSSDCAGELTSLQFCI
jgi:hypothetical protein